ncbi:kinesin-like protein KIN-14P [Sesamum indicum]|uniref:Kinesin-like protein KIN-14P n=1 Tax=Sesamum indicum TaxID=4182 RepID=A0A8M8VCK3_SESIN|nr:kinesin-like protein KIN-14P [Sesamum indicum]
MDREGKDCARFNNSSFSSNSDIFEPPSSNNAKQRATLIEWLNSTLDLSLPINASDEELRAFLVDGSILCQILNKLKPGSVTECGGSVHTPKSRLGNVQRFLSAMDEMGLPRFQAADLEKGSMKIVLDCLLTLQTQFMNIGRSRSDPSSRWKLLGERPVTGDTLPREESPRFLSSPPFGEDKKKLVIDSKFQRALRSRTMTDSSAALINHVGHKFHEVFQLKQGSYTDLPAAKISEMMKSNSLDNAPTQSLLSVVNGILDESIERKSGAIPHRVACLLRKVVQEIERRICTQAEHLRTQNNLFKAREEKYQSRIRVLEALATGTSEETQIVMNQLQQLKSEKNKIEERKRVEEQDVLRLIKEKDDLNQEIANLMQELEIARSSYEQESSKMKHETGGVEATGAEVGGTKVEGAEAGRAEAGGAEVGRAEAGGAEVGRAEAGGAEVGKAEAGGAEVGRAEAGGAEVGRAEAGGAEVGRAEARAEAGGAEVGGAEVRRAEAGGAKVGRAEAGGAEVGRAEAGGAEIGRAEGRIAEVGIAEAGGAEDGRAEAGRAEFRTAEAGRAEQELENRLKEVEGSLMESRNRVNEVEGLLMESRNRVKEVESALMESRNRVKEVESALMESRNRVNEFESALTESRNRVKEVESALMESRNGVNEFESALTESRNRVKEFESSLMESRNRVNEVESALSESRNKVKEVESLLMESRNREKELEAISESKSESWSKKENIYHIFTDFQLGALRELRFASQSIQQEIVRTKKSYSEGFSTLGSRIKVLDDAAKNYYSLLAENRKLHNELQELKGNIRVYCRIRPFLPGQKGKQSIVEYIGENGELIVVNPAKQGKEGRRSFKFDKVYGPTATQAEVFSDTQPLIQSVLDGYNVCIFAYGQTGSGKTYTMTGPDGATEEDWGVNYRALNNLFRISQSRQSSFTYEVSVQMVEIYNEQVRDLLSSDGTQKKTLGISTAKPNGLAVPDASVQAVNSTSDVLELMDIGLKNRAKSSTALNERSSRSHSVVSIHARGVDLKSGSSLRGSLHLVDLAGSERVDRSEVTGDRLKEAQHINKSLSALGDVIFALSQKNAHVPYRNSKLTQVLQSSLGGQAKTLMFVQLNPDVSSYSETLSTLKFAERVSGVELGAAKSSKDGRDVRELMEQVASLKEAIAKKDDEIETLQLHKDPKTAV